MTENAPPGSHDDALTRAAQAEQRLAVIERFRAEQLAVLSRALAAAQEIKQKAESDAAALLDRARFDVRVLDAAALRLRPTEPRLAAAVAALRATVPAAPSAPADAADPRAELEAARRRLAVYESFEDTVQSVLTAALRAAHEIRTRSEEESSQAAERLRAEQRALRDDVAQQRAERDALAQVVEGLQRARDELMAQRADQETAITALEADLERLRTAVAAETVALEQRRADRAGFEREAGARSDVAADRTLPPGDAGREAAAILRRELVEDIERLRAERASMVRERDFQSDAVTHLRGERDAVAQQLVGLREAFAAAVQQLVRTVAQAPLGASLPLEVTTAAQPATPAAAPAEAPEPAVPAAARLTAESEVRLVVSPVASFSGLVDLERRLQGFASIRSVYVKDFRAGVATLACNAATATSMQDLADMLARELDASIERVADGVIELRARAAEGKREQSGSA